jgi:anti-sigma factor RsiW
MTPRHDPARPPDLDRLTGAQREEWLTAYLDHELDPAAAQAVAVWLEAHPDMLREVETQRRVDDLLGLYPDPPVPAGFADRVLAAARGSTPLAVVRSPRRWLPLSAAALVLLGIGGLVGFGWGRGQGPTAEPPTALAALDALPAAALRDGALLDLLVGADDEAFEAWLDGDFDDLVADAG